ncbi:MAG: glycosyltransferase family 4 protein, partial [Halieaceae bacterium]|nr:glycosyltransferase family 4 protein [Halieaceae bacterium]
MKLAFAVFKYFPFGGMQRNMLAIARACVARGHEVTVFTGFWQGAQAEGIGLEVLPIKGLSNHQRNKNFYNSLHARLATKQFDGVVGFNKMPGLDIYYAGDSCFASKAYESRSIFYRMTPRSKMSLLFERAVFGRDSNTRILSVSELERAAFRRYYDTPEDRFDTLPPGITRQCIMTDNHQQERATIRSELGAINGDTLLLALGSGFKTKGLDRSIVLLSRLSKELNARLIVVGQDKERPLRSLAKKLRVDNRVTFLAGRSDVPAILQSVDVLVHPAYRENTGNVLLEAMVAGLPVVTTD